jgi:hypothetical protein
MIDIEHKITPNEILSFKKCKKRHQDWLNRKAARQTTSPDDVSAIVKGPDGREHQVAFEDIAKVSEKLGEIAGFQVIVHRPYELNDAKAA